MPRCCLPLAAALARRLCKIRGPAGDAGAGEKYTGLSDPLQKLFDAGKDVFGEAEEVVKDGLGPR